LAPSVDGCAALHTPLREADVARAR